VVWKREDFEEFMSRVRACAAGARPSSGTTFFLFVYDPKEERKCIDNMKQFKEALEGNGTKANIVWVGQLMVRVLQRRGYTPEILRDLEAHGRERLREPVSGLTATKGGLADDLVGALISGELGTPPLGGGAQSEVALLLRTGPLYPFVHVSEILSRLENRTQRTLGVAFPGSRDPTGESILRFLDEGTGRYYRATIIGG